MKRQPMFCTTCHTVDMSVKHTPGSFGLELLLWLVFFPVGLAYSCWRLVKRGQVCPHCQSSAIVPATSPAAVAILGKA